MATNLQEFMGNGVRLSKLLNLDNDTEICRQCEVRNKSWKRRVIKLESGTRYKYDRLSTYRDRIISKLTITGW